jgi:hypothetical protein
MYTRLNLYAFAIYTSPDRRGFLFEIDKRRDFILDERNKEIN